MVNVKPVQQKAARSKVAAKRAQVLSEYFVHQNGGIYNLFTDPSGVTQVLKVTTDQVLENLLFDHGMSPGTKSKPGIARQMVRQVRLNNVINGKISISGKKKGLYQVSDTRVLVDSEPRFIESKKGKWNTIREISEKLLGGFPEQLDITYGYLKCCREGLRKSMGNQRFRPGQAFIIKGEPNDGKTFFASSIMAPLIGRTCFNPLPYLSGKTENNGDLVGNEMWLIDDRGGAMDLDQRLTLSENMKNAIAGKGFQYHDKYEKAVSFTSSRLFNRIVFLVNNTDNSMRCLPSLEETRDKLIIVKSKSIVFSGNLKNDSDDDQDRLDKRIEDEMPAFAHFLDTFKIKNPCIRFGQSGFINSEAEFEIQDNEEHTALWSVMKKFVFRDGSSKTRVKGGTATTVFTATPEFLGTSSEIYAKLKANAGTEFEVLDIKGNRKMGRLIGMLSRAMPDHVLKLPRTSDVRGWRLINPDEII
jgi:hypothetical protein